MSGTEIDPPKGLQFPTDFPIKIMGRTDEGFAQAIVDIVLRSTHPTSIRPRWRCAVPRTRTTCR